MLARLINDEPSTDSGRRLPQKSEGKRSRMRRRELILLSVAAAA